MLTLAIETSGIQGTIALSRDGSLLGERALAAGRRHAQTLVPDIHALLSAFEFRPADCDLIAVSVGPGSFTGLRVGIVCAKAFAYATCRKVLGIDTLRVIAENCPAELAKVEVVIDAQRQELFVGALRRDPTGSWKPQCPTRIVSIGVWLASRDPECAVTGPGLERLVEGNHSLAEKIGGQVLERELWQSRAAAVARLAEQTDVGELTDCWRLEPDYLRKSAAEEKWEAAQQAAGNAGAAIGPTKSGG